LNDEFTKDPERVSVTLPARRLIEQLISTHGPIMFHQSGGCLGSVDEKVGEIAGCEFWMDRAQFRLWAHTRWTVDVVPGRGGSFSLEAPLNMRFIIRSEMCAVPSPET
jgi:uncharacterized protein (DUF779 family)